MKHQYQWINKLLSQIPRIKVNFGNREDRYDDDDYQYHGGGGHGHSHSHAEPDYNEPKKDGPTEDDIRLYKASMAKLKLVSFVSIFFIIAQCIGGYLANSIAIFTDTAHLASDMIGFMMSMVAMKMSMRPSSMNLTFGWHRAEVIGTMASIIFLLTLTIWLVFEATGRVVDPQEVKGLEMGITAICGLFFNLIQMHILHQGEGGYHMGEAPGKGCTHDHGDGEHAHEGGDDEEHYFYHGGHGEHGHGDKKKESEAQAYKSGRKNINVDAAFLHALGDMIMSIGVCISSTIIYFFPKAVLADPMCTFIFSIIVCVTVTPTINKCINVLMEGAPPSIDSEQLKKDIRSIGNELGGLVVVDDFHIWSISLGKFAAMMHVKHTEPGIGDKILKKVNKICKKEYGIDNVAIQIEDHSDPSMVQKISQELHKQVEIPDSPEPRQTDDGHGHGHAPAKKDDGHGH